MPVVYKSKIGFVFFIPLMAGTMLSTILMLNDPIGWVALLIMVVIVLFMAINFYSIRYIIDGENLIVKGFPFYNKIIPIDKITRIKETNNPLNSPAASMDRLEIRYNRFDSVIISPKEKQEFIDELLRINQLIEISYKPKNKKP